MVEKTYTEEQLIRAIELARHSKIVEGIRLPVPCYTIEEVKKIIANKDEKLNPNSPYYGGHYDISDDALNM